MKRINAGLVHASERADRLAVRAAASPYQVTFGLLALNLGLTALLIPPSAWLLDDPQWPLRELAPMTWISFAELLFIAACAWAVHVRLDPMGARRWRDFWSLSAVAFLILAAVEITQVTIFLDDLLELLGVGDPPGFRDLDSMLLVGLYLLIVAVLLRHVGAVLERPRMAVLIAIGVVLAAASQALDATLPATTAEFIAEDSLKLASEPFLIGGYLVALQGALAGSVAAAEVNARESTLRKPTADLD